ncbi:NADH-quinone oxidoreductase subunit C [Limnoglobus roseus]|uniref:NADH-quinone oxidoreductase subunit C n=1 Tax=Limnoglobus roseus TaxID=2598579 RepID=A0A5C1AT09_9BACT|nr:NADH-quinone oxidoreductase subunit C [Limnoglobus roseus]QEL20048.1 NADH-quinone oxidoreductase subunit C [Limnoglobus roseus]
MTSADVHALLLQQFPGTVSAGEPTTVEVVALVEVCRFLRDDPRLRFDLLNNISGVDYLETDAKKVAKAGFEPHLEVVYHLSSVAFPGRRFTLKVILPRWKDGVTGELPEVPTVSHLWRTADWHEREVYDLVGIRFTGHPDPRRILMADDWVGHPLRKDFEYPLEYHDIRCR